MKSFTVYVYCVIHEPFTVQSRQGIEKVDFKEKTIASTAIGHLRELFIYGRSIPALVSSPGLMQEPTRELLNHSSLPTATYTNLIIGLLKGQCHKEVLQFIKELFFKTVRGLQYCLGLRINSQDKMHYFSRNTAPLIMKLLFFLK